MIFGYSAKIYGQRTDPQSGYFLLLWSDLTHSPVTTVKHDNHILDNSNRAQANGAEAIVLLQALQIVTEAITDENAKKRDTKAGLSDPNTARSVYMHP
ncbi:hypothetical protein RRG08_040079 [Elysia crispata]|uniref:Uncharacterized protein n=1 Tax=Elysia crispata TaxID=231223 RepID=A0AAE0XWW0_9GAST|nr:hypothetical protein RRG08_040079 [Elysia crispata]